VKPACGGFYEPDTCSFGHEVEDFGNARDFLDHVRNVTLTSTPRQEIIMDCGLHFSRHPDHGIIPEFGNVNPALPGKPMALAKYNEHGFLEQAHCA
jgi:hypothetical protein